MGNISTSNKKFISADIIYSKVKRTLKSLDLANLIDDGEFPVYTKDFIQYVGLGLYKECNALLEVKNGKACLPSNFEYLYVAYKCSPNFNCNDDITRTHLQSSSFSFTIDATSRLSLLDNNCEIDCSLAGYRQTETICLKTYVTEKGDYSFGSLVPLRLAPNHSISCMDSCSNLMCNSAYEISLNNDTLHANFDNDFIYMKYYGTPLDENGDYMIPDITEIRRALEWYIIYQVLLASWFDSSIPDIQNKWAKAEQLYEQYMAELKFLEKLPAFSDMVNMIRNQNSQNKLVYMTRQYSNSNFQRF